MMLSRFIKLFANLEGVPQVLVTEEDRNLYRQRLMEAIPETGVALNAVLRGISNSDYLRNLTILKARQSEKKT